jgi:hypothetical protein
MTLARMFGVFSVALVALAAGTAAPAATTKPTAKLTIDYGTTTMAHYAGAVQSFTASTGNPGLPKTGEGGELVLRSTLTSSRAGWTKRHLKRHAQTATLVFTNSTKVLTYTLSNVWIVKFVTARTTRTGGVVMDVTFHYDKLEIASG